jgi:hypothetical protein
MSGEKLFTDYWPEIPVGALADADAVAIVDAGSYFTGTNLEAATQELGVSRAALPGTYRRFGRTIFSNANYTVLATDVGVFQTGAMSAPRTVTLPAASTVAAGIEIYIGDESGSVGATNTLTITRSGADLIDGATTTVITVPYGARRLFSNGVNRWTFDGGAFPRPTTNEIVDRVLAVQSVGPLVTKWVAVAAGGDMLKSENLSGLANYATARTNLGLAIGTDVQAVSKTINAQTGTTYTLVLADAGRVITASNAAAVTVTVPPNSSVAFPIGTEIDVIGIGAGLVTIAQGSGVTVNPAARVFRAQHSGATLLKIGTNTWQLVGDLA